MIVVPARDGDPRRLARRRVAPLRRDQQRRADDVAVESSVDGDAAARPRRPRPRASSSAGRHAVAALAASNSVRRSSLFSYIVPSAPSSASGTKSSLPGASPSLTRIVADRAALPRQPRADPDRIEHPPAGARDRRGAAVEPGRQRHRRIGGVDDDRGEPVRVERQRQRRADQPAAENDDICVHAAALRPPAVAANAR